MYLYSVTLYLLYCVRPERHSTAFRDALGVRKMTPRFGF